MAASGPGRSRRRRPLRATGVAQTSMEALAAKGACHALGYFSDPFLDEFGIKWKRKSPIIHRGYYARYRAFRETLKAFHAAMHGACQVIALGGGLDTTYFDLAKQDIRFARFVEVDLPAVTHFKAEAIQASSAMQDLLTAPPGAPAVRFEAGDAATGGSVVAADYALATCDLTGTAAVAAWLDESGLDSGLPTLVLAECVLVYMPSDCVQGLLATLHGAFDLVGLLAYDPVHPDDAFGRIMVDNLAAMGSPFRGIHDVPDEAALMQRSAAAGFHSSAALSMEAVWSNLVDKDEWKRLQRLEPLDEVEEWSIMMRHYAMYASVGGRLESGQAAPEPSPVAETTTEPPPEETNAQAMRRVLFAKLETDAK